MISGEYRFSPDFDFSKKIDETGRLILLTGSFDRTEVIVLSLIKIFDEGINSVDYRAQYYGTQQRKKSWNPFSYFSR